MKFIRDIGSSNLSVETKLCILHDMIAVRERELELLRQALVDIQAATNREPPKYHPCGYEPGAGLNGGIA